MGGPDRSKLELLVAACQPLAESLPLGAYEPLTCAEQCGLPR
jgi:hypothetical protein